TGVTGACSPASGLTGTTAFLTGPYVIPPNTVGCSGSGGAAVITIVAKTPVMTGDSISFTLAAGAGSNITDGSGDTSAGGTVSVTNNSVVTSTDVTGSDMLFQAPWGTATGTNPVRRAQGGSASPVSIEATGTAMYCNLWASGGTVTTIVDGTVADLTVTANTFIVWPIFTGLSNTAHTVTLEPSFLATSPFSCRIVGTGTHQFPPAYNTTMYPIMETPTTGLCANDGAPQSQTGHFGTQHNGWWPLQMDSMLRCPTAAGTTDLYIYGALNNTGNESTFVCFQDGHLQGTGFTINPAGLQWQYFHPCTGLLNDGQPHITQLFQT